MLVIQQPDGTLAQVPEWMTAPEAGSADIREEPRLPLTVLGQLRLGVDSALSSISDADNGGWHGTHVRRSLPNGTCSRHPSREPPWLRTWRSDFYPCWNGSCWK
jgi:hypothetical protein